MASPTAPAFPARERRIEALTGEAPDVLVVGGGITGAGVALDLVLRGLRVALVERRDWASETSSASSRLVHGGLRYLEQLDFALVRESCLERGLLLRNAAGLVWPERFTFPIHRGGPVGRWKLAAGLWLYTAVSVPRVLGLPELLGREGVVRALPGVAREGLIGGGAYLDAATDDARLCLAVVASAARAGALVLTRLEAEELESGSAGVRVSLRDRLTGERHALTPRAVVLCGGPRTDELRALAGLGGDWVRPTRGAHLLVERERLPTDGALILNSPVDGRVMFLVPRPRFTLIGTTDVDAEPNGEPCASRAEVEYLLESVNGLVPEADLRPDDVVSTYAGLRPLLAASESDPSARSREERTERDGSIYTIAGGKLTGYRAMAEPLGARIARDLGRGSAARRSPTRDHRLHGALSGLVARPDWSGWTTERSRAGDGDPLDTAFALRYGALSGAVRAACRAVEGGEEALTPDTLRGEVDWAVAREDCLTARDFLFRRTDVGLERPSLVSDAARFVVHRMGELLAWDAERAEAELASVCSSVQARLAWRQDRA